MGKIKEEDGENESKALKVPMTFYYCSITDLIHNHCHFALERILYNAFALLSWVMSLMALLMVKPLKCYQPSLFSNYLFGISPSLKRRKLWNQALWNQALPVTT